MVGPIRSLLNRLELGRDEEGKQVIRFRNAPSGGGCMEMVRAARERRQRRDEQEND